jgi:hypothetical protein
VNKEICDLALAEIDFVAVRSFAGQPMRRKERYIARLNEVTITREGDSAVIEYHEAGVPTTELKIGPEIADMSDEAILELFNDILRVQAQLAADYKHVAVEIPLGSPQIELSVPSGQWCPRGGVLRCQVEDDENGQLVVGIDDQELSLKEFGRMLTTYAGWGMRIEFVPEDQLHRRPALEVREPDPDDESAEG